MSCRSSSALQPARRRQQAARRNSRVMEALILIAHLGHSFCVDALQKLRRAGKVELLVARLDAEEESVIRGALETRHIKERAMRLGQFVQRKHAKHGKRRGAQNGEFECDRNERGPAVEGAASNIQRIIDNVHPVLEKEAAKTTAKSSKQGNLRYKIVLPTF